MLPQADNITISKDEYADLKAKAVSVEERERMVAGLMEHRAQPAPRKVTRPVRELTAEEKVERVARKKKRVAQRDARKRNRPRKKRR